MTATHFARRQLFLACASIPLLLRPRAAGGQAGRYPERPIRCVVPSTAGGSSDLLTRLVATQLGGALGQPVVIENKPGATGQIAMDHVAKSAADGYTLLVASNGTNLVSPIRSGAAGYDLRTSFAPVTKLVSISLVVAVSPALGLTTLSELIERARRDPGRLAFASNGVGSTSHLAAELLFRRAGVKLIHVPYVGTASSVKDVLSGEVPVLISQIGTIASPLRNGQLRALAVTGSRRVPAFAATPTVAESGFPGYDITSWHGVLAPAGTPGEIIARLHSELVRIVALRELQESLASMGMEPVGNSPSEFATELETDYRHWVALMRDAAKASE